MDEEVHYIPVGFDFERLVQPLHQDDFNADRVVLFHSKKKPENAREAEIAENIVEDLSGSMESVLDIDVQIEVINDIYDYMHIYEVAYQMIDAELNEGNRIYVNISSMPRTVAFAFATAVDTHILEHPEIRDDLTTYYVSPEKYLITEVREDLEDTVDILRELDIPDDSEEEVKKHLVKISNTLQKLEKGTTSGASEIKDGKHHVEFVAPPIVELTDAEEDMLEILGDQGGTDSISDLARLYADYIGEDCDESTKSATQYRVNNLEDKGLIKREEGEGGSHQISLTRIGKMWMSTGQ